MPSSLLFEHEKVLTVNDGKNTINLLPPNNTHFASPEHLKTELERCRENFKFDYENEDTPLNEVPTDKFEKVRVGDGSFILLPVDRSYVFLYRGQTAKYPTCTPTLFRQKTSPEELFLEHLKVTEFELLIKVHPIVEDVFAREQLNVDYIGLAQHYGFKTNVLDLTSDIDIALFFAMCEYSAQDDCYYPRKEDKGYTGYIYTYFTLQNIGNNPSDFFTKKLKAIGLQPFKRPGAQKGFSLTFEREDSFIASIFSFSYTKQDSEKHFNNFGQGKTLWVNDILAEKAKLIIDGHCYSHGALALAVKRMPSFGKGHNFYQDYLRNIGYTFRPDSRIMPWSWSVTEIEKINREWDARERIAFCESIVHRKLFRETDGWHDEIDINTIASEMILRVCAAVTK